MFHFSVSNVESQEIKYDLCTKLVHSFFVLVIVVTCTQFIYVKMYYSILTQHGWIIFFHYTQFGKTDFLGKMGRVSSNFDFWKSIFLKIDAKSHVVCNMYVISLKKIVVCFLWYLVPGRFFLWISEFGNSFIIFGRIFTHVRPPNL